jgi:carbon monoxide dehydrogenase subunit G
MSASQSPPFARETRRVSVERDRLWPVFDDAQLLARVLPGCEQLEAIEPHVYRGILATKLQFLTMRAEVTARVLDIRMPDALRLEIDGRPRGLAGSFRASIQIGLDVDDEPGTIVTYQVALTTSGRLSAFGAPLLRDTFRRQVGDLVANIERELGDGQAS